jgi:hypothetical protein
MVWFPEFVHNYLTFTGKCYRHCDKPTTIKVVSQDPDRVLGAYACPGGAVSHVVYFSLKPDLAWFEKFLSDQVGGENVQTRDIRLATRHGWELGKGAQHELESKLGPGGSVREVYWRRYPKTDDQKQRIVSLCTGTESKAGCLKLFMQGKESNERLCPACRARTT